MSRAHRPAVRGVARVAAAAALATMLSACTQFNAPAPVGTTITISANPGLIVINGGASTITVQLFKVDGSTVRDGTAVTFTTTLGEIPARSETSNGRVTVQLVAGNQRGMATVTARTGVDNSSTGTGNSLLEASVEVDIGVSASALTLAARPATLPPKGGKSTLLATVLDAAGEPVADVPVIFTTTAGRLESANGIVRSNGSGVARIQLQTDRPAVVTAQAHNLTAQRAISLDEDAPPQAVITVSPTTPAIRETVNFSGSASTDDSGIVAYDWDFGDGQRASGENVAHAYQEQGTFVATLEVRDDAGQVAIASESITVVRGQLPSPTFVFFPSTPAVGVALTFDAGGSIDPDGQIVRYAWSWGDGTSPSVVTGPRVMHTFYEPGTYTVVLTVRDDQGLEANTAQQVTVPDPAGATASR